MFVKRTTPVRNMDIADDVAVLKLLVGSGGYHVFFFQADPAFRFTGVIPLLWPRFSHSTPDTQFRVGSSLQAGLYARTPRSVRPLRLFR
ncbi:hypothetical protein DMW53_25670 [Serratia marcescens]|nr:hypothetical protein DMW53_25670 [Serratia marcescens]